MEFRGYYIATGVLVLISALLILLGLNGTIGYGKIYTIIFIITVIISMFKPFKIGSNEFKTISGVSAFTAGSLITLITLGILVNKFWGVLNFKMFHDYSYSLTLLMILASIQWILYIFVAKSKA